MDIEYLYNGIIIVDILDDISNCEWQKTGWGSSTRRYTELLYVSIRRIHTYGQRVSISGRYPDRWMVNFHGKSYENRWWLWVPLFLETPISSDQHMSQSCMAIKRDQFRACFEAAAVHLFGFKDIYGTTPKLRSFSGGWYIVLFLRFPFEESQYHPPK